MLYGQQQREAYADQYQDEQSYQDEHYAEGAEPDPEFKPAAPHPLEDSGGAIDPATGEPPSLG